MPFVAVDLGKPCSSTCSTEVHLEDSRRAPIAAVGKRWLHRSIKVGKGWMHAAWIGLVLLCLLGHAADSAEPLTVSLVLDGTTLEGTAAAWSNSEVLLLSRSGFLHAFAPQEAADYRVVSPHFRPFSQSEMRGQLMREFGRQFDVSGTGNYLVVHPAGQRDRWADRFEELYRSFVHYFSVRGLRPAQPAFPLVAVVLPSHEAFVEYVRAGGNAVPPGVIGFYSPRSNRVLLYDAAQGDEADALWQQNTVTIIHEATHQMAFNTRIHSRLALPPRWVGEGLAMLFEAPGVCDPQRYRLAADRINAERLTQFREFQQSGRPAGTVQRLIQDSDRLFATAPAAAYPESWALTYFLSETESAKYLDYLARTAAREPLKKYSAAEQLKEFTDVFGTDLKLLEARYLRYVSQLKARSSDALRGS